MSSRRLTASRSNSIMFSRLISLAFLSLLFRQTLASTQFTLDRCCQNSDCVPDGMCTFINITDTSFDVSPCEPGNEDCLCALDRIGAAMCIVDLECPEGELCQSSGGQFNSCISQCLLQESGMVELTEAQQAVCDEQPDFPSVCPAEGAPPPQPAVDTPDGDGLDGDPCAATSDCAPPRMCVSSEATFRECEAGEQCQCSQQTPPTPASTPSPSSQPVPLPDESAESSDDGQPMASGEEEDEVPSPALPDLDPGEPALSPMESPQIEVESPPVEAAGVAPTPESQVVATTTPEVTETPEPTTAVCVAVEELEGVQKVFEQDYHAWVLCDAAGSCATPGHMVMWNGAGMMMKSYCDTVGCERKVMAVNSPRWGAGAIAAKTKGLAYTSFAARWESSAEERVLAAVVRLAV